MLHLDTTSDFANSIKSREDIGSQFIGVLPIQVVDKLGGEVGNIAIFNSSLNNQKVGSDDVLETVFVLSQDGDQVAITKEQIECLLTAISQIS